MKTLSRAKRLAALVLGLSLLPITSCGDSTGPEESVYLFVINGYTAASTISIFGPRGPVVQGLKFGERTPEPIEVNRSLGTEFTLLLDGTPTPIDLDFQLFSLYPQETATMFLKRRSDAEDASVSLYRHVQTISRSCAFTFENGLSVDNQFTSDAFNFSWAPEFNYDPNVAGYFTDETSIPVITECGPLPTPTRSPIPRDFSTTVIPDPWFFKTTCQDSLQPNLLCDVWGELDNGAIIGLPPTQEYFECVAQAISIKQPEDAMNPSPFPPADAQVQCPPGALTWDDVQVDPNGVDECKAGKRYPAFLLEPTQTGQQTWTLIRGPDDFSCSGDDCECTETFRIRNDGLAVSTGFDVIFGPQGDDAKGQHLDGDLVTSTVVVPGGSEHFYVMFGRPVNPIVWQWNSGENFVDLNQFPYSNDQDGRIGEYSDPEGAGGNANNANNGN